MVLYLVPGFSNGPEKGPNHSHVALQQMRITESKMPPNQQRQKNWAWSSSSMSNEYQSKPPKSTGCVSPISKKYYCKGVLSQIVFWRNQ